MKPFHYLSKKHCEPYSTPKYNDNTPKFTVGDTYRFNTHAEFLNEVFGTNYKAWMKCGWRYKSNAFVWFVRFAGKEGNEFINLWSGKDIIQRYVGTDGLWNGEPIKLDEPNDYRLVFEIYDGDKRQGTKRQYVFKGVFLMDRESTETEMIFNKKSDYYPMN